MIEHIWKGEGFRCIAFINQHGTLSHKWFTTNELAQKFATWATSQRIEMWYAVSLYNDGSRRRQANVRSVGALFLDLDCGETKDFPTQNDAVRALKDFCEVAELRKPVVVGSGNGIHAYWLIPHMTVEEWQVQADRLKALCVQHGFKADPARTADAASLMRLPGTYNFKDPSDPKAVQIYAPSDIVELPTMPEIAVKQKSAVDTSIFPPARDGDADAIASKCAQLGAVKESRGLVDEPLWYAALQVLNHCKDGDSVAHAWSDGHESYSADEVDERMQRLREGGIGPSTCDRIHALNPDGCKGCPLYGKITSPIQLGPDAGEEVKSPETAPERVVPDGWAVGSNGVVFQPDDGPPVKVLNVPFYVARLGRIDGETVAVMQWKTMVGNWMTADLPLVTLAEPRAIRNWLLTNSIVGTWVGKEKHVIMYLQQALEKMQETKDPTVIAHQFGWQSSDEFLWGRKSVTSAGTSESRPSDSMPRGMVNGMISSGDRSVWLEAAKVFDKPGYETQAFAILAALAAPIMNIIDVPGAVLSLAGPSGTGKSTAARFGLSVFGKPDSLMLSPESTNVARDAMMRSANTLPVGIDDLSGKHAKMVGGLMYMAANGRAKERGNQEGNLREMSTWQTVLTISTNNPMLDLPDKYLVEAERRRVLELPVITPIAREDAVIINHAMRDNYGVIAEEYITVLVRQREYIAKVTNGIVEQFASRDDIPDQNRFGVWLCAAAWVAGKLLSDEGIISFDYDRIVANALSVLVSTAADVLSGVELVDNALSEYLLTHAGQVTRKTRKGGRATWTQSEVKGTTVAACMVDGEDVVLVPTTIFKDFMFENNVPSTAIKEWSTHYNVTSVVEPLQPSALGGKSIRCYTIPHYFKEESNGNNE